MTIEDRIARLAGAVGIFDGAGTLLGMAGANKKDGGFFGANCTNGKNAATLGADANGGIVMLFDPDERPLMSLFVSAKREAQITFAGGNNRFLRRIYADPAKDSYNPK